MVKCQRFTRWLIEIGCFLQNDEETGDQGSFQEEDREEEEESDGEMEKEMFEAEGKGRERAKQTSCHR